MLLDTKLTISAKKLTCFYIIKPSALSRDYEIYFEYRLGNNPDVYILEPKLEYVDGKSFLPHVYDTSSQRLCLYYRKTGEWNSSMYIADAIIPWTSEWLLHYEYWLGTGEWHGGGIHIGKKTHVN